MERIEDIMIETSPPSSQECNVELTDIQTTAADTTPEPLVKSDPASQEFAHTFRTMPEAVMIKSEASGTQFHTSMTAQGIQLSTQPASMDAGPRGEKRKVVITLTDDDDWDEMVEPYDMSKERFPQTPMHHPSFGKAEICYHSVVQTIATILGADSSRDEDINYLRKRTEFLTIIGYPADLIIALRGNSGTGKSSLINSSLGIPDIAAQSDGGAACTAVVQEFRTTKPDQNSPFESEIIFLNKSCRNSALQDYIKNYLEFNQVDITPSDESYEALQKASMTSVDAVLALFCDHEECCNAEAVEEFLGSATSTDDSKVLQKMEGWLSQRLERLDIESGKVTISAPTIAELQDKIEPFILARDQESLRENPRSSLWPIVKVVRTYLDSFLLKQNIVLADLPGVSDMNVTRVEASNAYMRNADYIGVVGRIDRAETDTDINQYLVDAYKRKRGSSVFLVLTYTDNINLNSHRIIQNADPIAESNINTLQNELQTNGMELDHVKQELKRNRMQKGSRDEAEDLHRRKAQLEFDKATIQAQYSEYCIGRRNKKVTKVLQTKYHSITRDAYTLPTFCVSNSEYQYHVAGYEKMRPPKLSMEGTGVPALRRHLYSLPANRRFSVLDHYCNVLLPSLLNMIEMACSHSKLKRRGQLEQIIIAPQSALASEIENVYQNFKKSSIEALLSTIKASRSQWVMHAKTRLEGWATWNAASYKAFMRHNGQWKTKRGGKFRSFDWNEELLLPVEKDLDEAFRAFDDAGTSLSKQFTSTFETVITETINKLNDTAGPSKDALKTFINDLELQKLTFERLSDGYAIKFEQDLHLLREDITTSSNTKQSYFMLGLFSTYKKCGEMAGKGAHRNRVDAFEKKVCDKARGPYMKIYEKARDDSTKLIEHHTTELTNAAVEIFKDIHRTFLLNFNTQEDDSPEAKALREKLRAEVPSARTIIEGELSRYLDECRSAGRAHK